MRTLGCLVLILVFFVLFVNVADSSSLRQRLFEYNGTCQAHEFQCLNDECIGRSQLCNGRYDCRDRSDEEYCREGSCPEYRPFSCYNSHSGKYRCIPQAWKCDGFEDCSNRKDEENCEIFEKGILTAGYIRKRGSLAKNWTLEQRKTDQPTRKWSSEVDRVAVALYLFDSISFQRNRTIRDEIAYELSLGLLTRMALKSIKDVSSTEMASYINAFLLTCIDPRKFYVVDLVHELRKRADAQNSTNPSVLLALCNAEERMTERDVEKLKALFWKAHSNYQTDTQALVVMALVCAAEQAQGVVDIAEIREMAMEIKERQYRNGTVENLKTTALVMQALIALEREADEDNFDEEKALKQILLSQREDGSFGNIVNTYYVLPVLGYRSLVNISSSHCEIPLLDEQEALKDLLNQGGEKVNVQLSLWIGDNRTMERTLTLKVPFSSSFYRVMELAAGVDNRFRFEYYMRNGKPYIYSISGIQDDPENGMFWFPLTANPEAKEITPITKSPADIIPGNKQHLIFWYKCES